MRKEEKGNGAMTAEELRELFEELPDGQICILSFAEADWDGEEDGV